jgi:N-acetylglucosaminyldiphosphoundecaprenol N-acetyl-beta-D-mannosaminyltransferase
MDLMLAVCDAAAKQNIAIGLFGSSQGTLDRLEEVLAKQFKGLKISCAISPPFREISREEEQSFLESISRSGTRILFVGLGCPKQEIWMAEHMNSIPVTMLGVGAAFDFISGSKRTAPAFVQKVGLEWFFRLVAEPRRLVKRYLKQNPRFVFHFVKQMLFK